jgi:hypothetical protein
MLKILGVLQIIFVALFFSKKIILLFNKIIITL